MPKKNRLTSKKDIDRVFKNGETIKGRFLFIKQLDSSREYPRFAFIVSSKHVSLAVDRNKIRRIFSEEIAKMLLLGFNRDTIVVVYKKTERGQFKELGEEFREILLKLT